MKKKIRASKVGKGSRTSTVENQIRLQTETSTIETDYELERIREEKNGI